MRKALDPLRVVALWMAFALGGTRALSAAEPVAPVPAAPPAVPAPAGPILFVGTNSPADAGILNAAIASSPVGVEIVIRGTCLLNQTVRLLGDRSYRGESRTGTLLRQADGANLAALVASSVFLDNAAGWIIERNHIYGVPQNAIYAHRLFATAISNNYIEGFGEGPQKGTWHGICATLQGGAASTITGNRIFNFGGEKNAEKRFADPRVTLSAGL